jgi:hypothetical protein
VDDDQHEEEDESPDDDEWTDDEEYEDDDSEVDDDAPSARPPTLPGEPYLPGSVTRLTLRDSHRTLLRSWSLPEDTPLYLVDGNSPPIITHRIDSFIVESQPYRVRVPDLFMAMELHAPTARSPHFYAWLVDPDSTSELLDDHGNVHRMERAGHPHMRGINGGGLGSICMGNLPTTICQLYEQADLTTIWAFLALGLVNYNPSSPYWRVEDAAPLYECGKCRNRFRSLVPPPIHTVERNTYRFCSSCTPLLAKAPSVAHFMGLVCSICQGGCTDDRLFVSDPRPGQPSTSHKLCRRCYDEHQGARRCKSPTCSCLTDSVHHPLCFLHYPLLRSSKQDVYRNPTQYIFNFGTHILVGPSLPAGSIRCPCCNLVATRNKKIYTKGGDSRLICESCYTRCNWCDQPVDPALYYARGSMVALACPDCVQSYTKTTTIQSKRNTAAMEFLELHKYEAFTCTECNTVCRDGGHPYQYRGHLFGDDLCKSCVKKKVLCRACTHMFPKPHVHFLDEVSDWICISCSQAPNPSIPSNSLLFNPRLPISIHECIQCHEHFVFGDGMRVYNSVITPDDPDQHLVYVCKSCYTRTPPVACGECSAFLTPDQVRPMRANSFPACPRCYEAGTRECTVCNQRTWHFDMRESNPSVCQSCTPPRRTTRTT